MKNTYLCKCGRIVRKSTNADTTGNRDISGCTGCPYLLPYGEGEYIEGEGFRLRVMGYECRMSKSLQYASRFSGSVIDTCACYVVSLDYEFLEQISDWIKENYPGKELSGGFSQKRIRATDFVSEGRYRFAIACAHNKKGMAAKSALLERFFHPDGSRRDMTPEEEEKKIKDLIENEKRAAQGTATKLEQTTEPAPTPAAPEDPAVPAPCLCESCTCTGCKPECFGHCQGCGEPTRDCNSYQTDGYKFGYAPPAAADASSATEALAPVANAETLPVFDYSGLDADTALHLQNLARRAIESKQRYYLDMMEIVYEAHRELVPLWDKHSNQHSDNTFRAWCASIGVSKTAAYRLLQVQALMDNSTPEEQEILEAAPANLLYAAAKPSAPAEAVAAVKSGDITTHKDYIELVEQLKIEQAARDASEKKAQEAHAREEEARAAAHRYHVAKEEAEAQRNAMIDRESDWAKRIADAQAERSNAEQERDTARAMLQKTKSRIIILEDDRNAVVAKLEKARAELAELRAQPIEVAVEKPDPAEIERLAKEKAEAMTAQLQEQLTELAQKNLESSRHAWNVASADFDMVEFAAQTIENAWLQAAPAWNRMELNARFALRGNLERAIDGITQALRACEEAADGGV